MLSKKLAQLPIRKTEQSLLKTLVDEAVKLETENEALREWLIKATSTLGYYLMEMGATTGEAWEDMRANNIPHLEHGEMWFPEGE